MSAPTYNKLVLGKCRDCGCLTIFIDRVMILGSKSGKRIRKAKRQCKACGSQRIDTSRPSDLKTDEVGRNDTCPCGSGEKYKQCCLDKGAA